MEYSLTERGRTLESLIAELMDWGYFKEKNYLELNIRWANGQDPAKIKPQHT
ncbi:MULTISPECIES: winged helix-turn-helix transcriptional regulator [Hwangdonia]|uniref:Winged helix-turn-helix transcriptional regulator n=1 Tax=Hwangdonia seohaensis TaxID=1240727 RepID=A0ABW3R8Y8_9FLAO